MTWIADWTRASDEERAALLARPPRREEAALRDTVREIVEAVRKEGWAAASRYARLIDQAEPCALAVGPDADRAERTLGAEALDAIRLAYDHVAAFHRAALPRDVEVETAVGLVITKRWLPLDRVGLYVPGGKAPLFSTLLMLAVPARIAGVGEIVCVTPPRPDGSLDPAVAYCARLCGIETIWTVGGAQAIAALAFGAGNISRVDRICGPGNRWVSAAKALVASLPGGPGIDLPAGPSELMVIADGSADPATVAADLLSQAEHDLDAQVLLVTTDRDVARATLDEADRQQSAMGGDFAPVRAIFVPTLEGAIDIANAYAPEHLSLALSPADATACAHRVRNAGTVFVGHAAAETFGDYCAGPSHVLPTDGAARFTGGVSTHTFMKAVGFQRIERQGAREIARTAAALARLEGLEAHARAAEARLGKALV